MAATHDDDVKATLFHVKHLLPNAKAAENLAEHIFNIYPSGNTPNRMLRQPYFLRHDFTRQIGLGLNSVEGLDGGRKRLPMAFSRQRGDLASDLEPVAREALQLLLQLL
jgi:hypothetical protein